MTVKPAARAICTAAVPTPPLAPCTSTVSPATPCPRRAAGPARLPGARPPARRTRELESLSSFPPSFALESLRVVARETVEGGRLFFADSADVVGHLGGIARGEDFVETFERADEPFGQARRERALSELLRRDGDVSDLPAGRVRELRGHVRVRKRLRPSEDVSLALMPFFRERARGDRGDVAHVYEARPGVADRLVDAALGVDLLRLAEKVLHEEVRPEHRPREAGPFQVIFGLTVPFAEAFVCCGVSPDGRELHDVAHARALPCPDEV